MIVGRNGVGKTNILEAIHVLLQGRSFRDSDEELLRYEQEWWKVSGQLPGGERELRYQLGQPSPKQLLVDGVSKGRFTYRHQLPVVLFEPDDLLMLHGGPGMRRHYLDSLLVKLLPAYRQTLAKYERALLQRNNLLKKELPLTALRDAVFVWDIALSEYGSEIIRQRSWLVGAFNTTLSGHYSAIANNQQPVTVHYTHNASQTAQHTAEYLSKTIDKDALRGFTSIGPHRDDLQFMLNGKNVQQSASRGEIRTLVLALKAAELELLQQAHKGSTPLFLLDDVFSELDHERQQSLLTHTKHVQKIITATHEPVRSVATVLRLP